MFPTERPSARLQERPTGTMARPLLSMASAGVVLWAFGLVHQARGQEDAAAKRQVFKKQGILALSRLSP